MLKFISSVRLAVILIAALVGLAVAGTIYDLPEIYHSLPFRLLAVAFFINLLTCSVQLWPKVAHLLRRGADSLEGKEASFQESTLDAAGLEAALQSEHFKKGVHETAQGQYILARQHLPGLFAPHILHIGLLVIIIGAFVASFAVTGQLIITPGEEQPFPRSIEERIGEGSIKVNDFETRYDDDGAVENWITTFDLTRGGKQVAKAATASVNHPYKEDGLSIYQMAYKNMYVVHIEGAGDETGDYAVPESQRFPLGNHTIDIEPMADDISLLYIFDADNKEVGSHAFEVGSKISIDDETTIEYLQPMASTVLEFKYSRAIPILFAGFIIAALGSVLSLVGRYGEVYAFVGRDGAVRVSISNKSPYIRRRQRRIFGVEEQENKE